MNEQADPSDADQDSVLRGALRKGILLGLAVLAMVVPPSLRDEGAASVPALARQDAFPAAVARSTPTVAAPRVSLVPPVPEIVPETPAVHRRAVFGKEPASSDVRHVANWAFHTGDNEGRSVVVIDKRLARVFVFDPEGTLVSTTAALLGSAVGDHTVPGVGDKPLSLVTPEERTTPAGRFVAEPGMNTNGEDVVWVDYDAAVSMHRVRPNVKAERRLERLASPTPNDNRISFGCINLPVAFYEKVLSPTVRKTGAVVYVLPEVMSVQALFGSFDVPAASLIARR